MKTQSMFFSEFMRGENKEPKEKSNSTKVIKKVGTSSAVPLVAAKPAFASGAVEAVPAGASQYIGETTLEIIAHALDPLVDLMVALSFPVCSVIIVGSCFFFMLGKSERAWSGIQNAGLGYILIQIMPMLLKVLKEIGSAI
ncbi:MAG: hypothetical protein ACQEXB_18300 [Bacillota bacterium]